MPGELQITPFCAPQRMNAEIPMPCRSADPARHVQCSESATATTGRVGYDGTVRGWVMKCGSLAVPPGPTGTLRLLVRFPRLLDWGQGRESPVGPSVGVFDPLQAEPGLRPMLAACRMPCMSVRTGRASA